MVQGFQHRNQNIDDMGTSDIMNTFEFIETFSFGWFIQMSKWLETRFLVIKCPEIDWCCFHDFVRNSLVALLEAPCARIFSLDSWISGVFWFWCLQSCVSTILKKSDLSDKSLIKCPKMKLSESRSSGDSWYQYSKYVKPENSFWIFRWRTGSRV